MPVPYPLQPASYNGVPFYVEAESRASGRRIVAHEFPKKDIPYSEDMGRRIRRFAVTAYIIYSPVLDPDWEAHRDDLIRELEFEGNGTLQLPTLVNEDVVTVVVDTYSLTEHREKGGYCEFQIAFTEAGQAPSAFVGTDTASSLDAAAALGLNTLSGGVVNPTNNIIATPADTVAV